MIELNTREYAMTGGDISFNSNNYIAILIVVNEYNKFSQ